MSDDSALRQKARAALHGGQIPCRRPRRTWGGPGAGLRCSICELPVKQDEVEFEMEFAPPDADSAPRSYQVHLRCFVAWEFERQYLEMSNGVLNANGHTRRSV